LLRLVINTYYLFFPSQNNGHIRFLRKRLIVLISIIKLVSFIEISLLIVVSGVIKLDVNTYAEDKEDTSCFRKLNSIGRDNA